MFILVLFRSFSLSLFLSQKRKEGEGETLPSVQFSFPKQICFSFIGKGERSKKMIEYPDPFFFLPSPFSCLFSSQSFLICMLFVFCFFVFWKNKHSLNVSWMWMKLTIQHWTTLSLVSLFFVFPKTDPFLFCQYSFSFFSKSTFDIEITFNFGLHSKMFIHCHCYLNNRTTTTKITNQTILNRDLITATTTTTKSTWTIIFKIVSIRIFLMSLTPQGKPKKTETITEK